MSIFENFIYIVDYSNDNIYVFTLDGFLVGDLDIRTGDLGTANAMAIRPGIFALLSMIDSGEIETTAGFLSSHPLDLRDVKNQPITASLLPDPDCFTTFATGEIDVNGEMREITISSYVFKTSNDEFRVATTITSMGTFQLHVLEGTSGIQTSFKNSPITITITPTKTEAKETVVDFEDVGDYRIFTLTTHDAYNKPTSHDKDVITYRFIDDDTEKTSASKTIEIKKSFTFSDTETLLIYVNDVEVGREDIKFEGAVNPTYFGVGVAVFITIVSILIRQHLKERSRRKKIYAERKT